MQPSVGWVTAVGSWCAGAAAGAFADSEEGDGRDMDEWSGCRKDRWRAGLLASVSWCRQWHAVGGCPLPPMVTGEDHIAWRENADMTSMSAGSSTPYIPASSPRSADVVLYLDLDGVDRKSTRLNSSHQIISYAVFCLKKKNINISFINTSQRKPHT